MKRQLSGEAQHAAAPWRSRHSQKTHRAIVRMHLRASFRPTFRLVGDILFSVARVSRAKSVFWLLLLFQPGPRAATQPSHEREPASPSEQSRWHTNAYLGLQGIGDGFHRVLAKASVDDVAVLCQRKRRCTSPRSAPPITMATSALVKHGHCRFRSVKGGTSTSAPIPVLASSAENSSMAAAKSRTVAASIEARRASSAGWREART